MSSLKISLYNDGERFISVGAKHLDATDLQTLIYLHCEPGQEQKNTIRLVQSISSINIVRGTVTIYYNNGSYAIITNA
jgi:hypothetical protein